MDISDTSFRKLLQLERTNPFLSSFDLLIEK